MAGPAPKSSRCAAMNAPRVPRVGFRRSAGAKVPDCQIEIEGKRLRSSKEYTIYISACKKDTIQRIKNYTCRSGLAQQFYSGRKVEWVE
jgi:hypothetical protein